MDDRSDPDDYMGTTLYLDLSWFTVKSGQSYRSG